MSAVLGGISNRNEKAIELLTDYAIGFQRRDEVVKLLENAADFILRMGFRGKSYWLNKANVFTLLVGVAELQKAEHQIEPARIHSALEEFEKAIPADYKLAATEAVNSTRARQLRNKYITHLMIENMG